jgi:hypothetical protein
MLKDCKNRNVMQQLSWETSGRGLPANPNSIKPSRTTTTSITNLDKEIQRFKNAS